MSSKTRDISIAEQNIKKRQLHSAAAISGLFDSFVNEADFR